LIVVVIVDYPIASQKGELKLLSIFFLIQNKKQKTKNKNKNKNKKQKQMLFDFSRSGGISSDVISKNTEKNKN